MWLNLKLNRNNFEIQLLTHFTMCEQKLFLSSRFYLSLFFLFITLSCSKDDSLESENEELLGDPNYTEGRFSDHLSCDIIAVPTGVGLSSYYTKYINCSGIPVIGSAAVPDEALLMANETTEFMLNGLGNVKAQLIKDGNYIALYPEGSNITDLPELFEATNGNTGAYTWLGSGENDLRAMASDVASLLCYPNGPVGHVFVHEMAHMMHIGGYRLIDGSFESEIGSIYNQSIGSGKWNNTYASTNRAELLAEADTIYYGVNWIGPEGGDGFRNEVGTRAQLQAYDPALYGFINSHFNTNTNLPGCREPVISGVNASCPATVTDIDGNVYEVINIGPMCWLKENLNTTRYRDGTPILYLPTEEEWQNTSSGAWSSAGNDPNNDVIYGKLYNGYALTNTSKICPEGWRVPTFQELQDLVNYIGGDHTSFNLKATTLWNSSPYPGTDMYGFSALPAGDRNPEGITGGLGNWAIFGSQTYSNEGYYGKSIFNDNVFIFNFNESKNKGTSCRCIKE